MSVVSRPWNRLSVAGKIILPLILVVVAVSVAMVVLSADEPTPAAIFGGGSLDAAPLLARAARAWGDQAALGLFVDSRLVAPGGPDDAPASLVVGKRRERIAVTLDLSPGALRSLARFWAR